VYSHLQPGLRIGTFNDPVVAGQWIGQIASNTNGPHLHLEPRTYGLNTFDITTTPLVFVNAWQYFNPTIQGYIDQNLVNRHNDDSQAVPGWDGIYSAGTQRTQCFVSPASPPAGAPSGATTGITVYGLTNTGNTNYSAFEWIDNTGTRQPLEQTISNNWQYYCMP
jgi:murein DD-endopeptidase MepM/ murein hydrolase activator NlpD